MREVCRLPARSFIVGAFVSILALQLTPLCSADSFSPLYRLLDAAAQRLQTADPIAAVKFTSGAPLDDPVREQQVIDTVTTTAEEKGIDAEYVKDVFRNEIDATNAIEHARFADWKLDPGAAPVPSSDLAASRATIDQLNQTMVDEIVDHWDLLHSPSCGNELDKARIAVTAARQFDALFQRALTYASGSYCR